jgi:hypothetical protein
VGDEIVDDLEFVLRPAGIYVGRTGAAGIERTAPDVWWRGCIFSLFSAEGTRTVAGRVPRDNDVELNGAGRRAVACWAQFPVGVIPRPLVLLVRQAPIVL